MRRILVTGAGGQVGSALLAALPAQGFEALPAGRPALDFDRPASIEALLAGTAPEAVVNCAAWTAVDAAEENEPAAFRANALGPALLARGCAARGIPLVQLSTDYVFDGTKGAPYAEADAPNPLGAYGRTKLAGEWAALAGNPRSIVLRTSWIYAPSGTNFLRTMLRLAAERRDLSVVADQIGAPTAAADLAEAIAAILARIRAEGWRPAHGGVFHATAAGHTSWHGFAEAIFAAARPHGGPSPRIRAITSGEYPARARRPADGRLDCARLAAVFGVRLPPWQEGLARVMRALHAA
jgi:dTDP-4-dehydrorhamnose reductase